MESIIRIGAIFKKELRQVFNTALGYTIIIVFLFIENFIFFYGFGGSSVWERKNSELGLFFIIIPYLLLLFVSAIGMRIWSVEREAGTWEILFTLPFKEWEIVAGKYLASCFYVLVSLTVTIFIPLTIGVLGDPDWGVIFTGYMGALLVGFTFVSIVLYFSLHIFTQIGAFLLGFLALVFFFLLGNQRLIDLASDEYFGWVRIFSIQNHYETFRMGILDPRDFYFFVSVIFLFLILSTLHLREKR